MNYKIEFSIASGRFANKKCYLIQYTVNNNIIENAKVGYKPLLFNTIQDAKDVAYIILIRNIKIAKHKKCFNGGFNVISDFKIVEE